MTIVALVLALLAAAIHGYIFVLESLRWTDPKTRAVFGTSENDAAITKPLAFNQGVYNLFLGIIAAIGAVVLVSGSTGVGAALIYAGCGSMLAAALVLILSDPGKARAAVTQGIFPLLALIATTIAVL